MNELVEILEKYLDRAQHTKAYTADALISFDKTLIINNKALLKVMKARDSNRRNNKIHNVNIDKKLYRAIISLKQKLILYIGTWYIKVQQGVISATDISKSLSPILKLEHLLLASSIKHYLNQPYTVIFNSALNCQKFFQDCDIISHRGDKND